MKNEMKSNRRLEDPIFKNAEDNHIEVGEAFGFHWINGHDWGVAHPDANCYADAGCASVTKNAIRLGVVFRPDHFHGKTYPWAVGLIRSRETIKYGRLDVWFRLPEGRNLQPAVWLYDALLWPPEIDIIEAWSCTPKWWTRSDSLYRRGLFTDKAHPSVILGDTEDLVIRGGSPRAAMWHSVLELKGHNRATMEWTEDFIAVEYNGWTALYITREDHPKVIEKMNASQGMNIFLNNYTTNDFTNDDFLDCQTPFRVDYLHYTPY